MTMWFRSWHGAPTDPKWLLIAKKAGVPPIVVSGIVWALFDYASQREDRGCVVGFDTETYAVWSGVEEAEVEAVITALTAKGVIEDGRLTAWEKRQPKREDDSRERVRAYRERKAAQAASNKEDVTPEPDDPEPVTPCNADVTQRNAPEKIQRREDTEGEGTPDIAPDKPARSRPRNATWDALAAQCGHPETDSEASDFGKTVKELKQARASPEEIAAFAIWWDHEMPPGTMLTHRCYRSHWSKFKNGLKRAAGTNSNGRIKDPLALARKIIVSRGQLDGASGNTGGVHDRPARYEREPDRRVDAHVPQLPDGRA